MSKLVATYAENGYCIVSALRHELPKSENNQMDIDLKHDLSKSGFSFSTIYGGYKETDSDGNLVPVFEKSFLVYNFGRDGKLRDFIELVHLMERLTGKYNQDAFTAVFPGKPAAWKDKDGKVIQKFKRDMVLNDVLQEFFSTMRRSKTGRARFTFQVADESSSESELEEAVEISVWQPGTINGWRLCDLLGEVYDRHWPREAWIEIEA